MITTHGWGSGAITTGGIGGIAGEQTPEIQYVFAPEQISTTEVTYGIVSHFNPKCIIVCLDYDDEPNLPVGVAIIGS